MRQACPGRRPPGQNPFRWEAHCRRPRRGRTRSDVCRQGNHRTTLACGVGRDTSKALCLRRHPNRRGHLQAHGKSRRHPLEQARVCAAVPSQVLHCTCSTSGACGLDNSRRRFDTTPPCARSYVALLEEVCLWHSGQPLRKEHRRESAHQPIRQPLSGCVGNSTRSEAAGSAPPQHVANVMYTAYTCREQRQGTLGSRRTRVHDDQADVIYRVIMYFGLESSILFFGVASTSRQHCLRSAAFKFLGRANDYLGSHDSIVLAASKDSQSTKRARTKIRFTRLARWFLAEPPVKHIFMQANLRRGLRTHLPKSPLNDRNAGPLLGAPAPGLRVLGCA